MVQVNTAGEGNLPVIMCISVCGLHLLQYSQCSWEQDMCFLKDPEPLETLTCAFVNTWSKSIYGLSRVWEGVWWDYMQWKWLIGHSVWGCQWSLERGGGGSLGNGAQINVLWCVVCHVPDLCAVCQGVRVLASVTALYITVSAHTVIFSANEWLWVLFCECCVGVCV